jgi:hypothetical protein
MSNHSINFFIGLVLITILILSANSISGILFPNESAITPQIIPDPVKVQTPPFIISQIFPFENTKVSISFPVNVSNLEGTRNTRKATSVHDNYSDSLWIADGYRAKVKDPAQDQIFSDLLKELNKVRLLQGLSDDEYLELMTVYVQSLRYESLEQNPAKFPVETVIDGAGDCDDKSLLLAGLLVREGYSVALLSFGPESHMAIGVGSYDYLYKKTGYAFIETTNYSFVGVPTGTLGDNLTLYSDPSIIIINKGEKFYTRGNDTRYIHDNYLKSDKKVKELALQLKGLNDDLMAKRIRIGELDSQIAQLKNSDNIKEYNSQVLAYTTLISIYNTRLASYSQTYTEYQTYADIHNYISEHKYDRKGVYDYIKRNMPFW